MFNNRIYILFSVYFSCFNESSDYGDEIVSLCGFIENILVNNSFHEIIILGDTNFDLNIHNAGYNIFSSLLCDMCACDVLVTGRVLLLIHKLMRHLVHHSVSTTS